MAPGTLSCTGRLTERADSERTQPAAADEPDGEEANGERPAEEDWSTDRSGRTELPGRSGRTVPELAWSDDGASPESAAGESEPVSLAGVSATRPAGVPVARLAGAPVADGVSVEEPPGASVGAASVGAASVGPLPVDGPVPVGAPLVDGPPAVAVASVGLLAVDPASAGGWS